MPNSGNFFEKQRSASIQNKSRLCVGLDPDPNRLPKGVDLKDFLFSIVDATSDLVASYKPNAAFFEREGVAGYRLLQELIEIIPEHIPVILDAKRGDIGHTAAAYATAVFDVMKADAVTVNPYLGTDSLRPFLDHTEKGVFILCKTSNASAGEFQDLLVGDEKIPLYLRVAELANNWNEHSNVGLVVGATYPEEAARIRATAPDLEFLIPGVGAQAGDLAAVVDASIDRNGQGFVISSSRGILYAWETGEAGDPGYAPGGWQDAAREAANQARIEILNVVDSRGKTWGDA
ncbi:MAG TPA: orotidine-5'-phosphate decarboxylase [Dehalococcoidia bacterium]|jgi:orotidine-5'-phosphate decarboxylase|nr:orotidine-5'-phosphate decarboxylase [Dehalococcoidia bacterium]